MHIFTSNYYSMKKEDFTCYEDNEEKQITEKKEDLIHYKNFKEK